MTDELGIDPLANVSEQRRFNTGSIILVAVVGVALTGLWFMRTISQVSGNSGTDTDAQIAIEKFIKGMKGGASGDPKNASALVKSDPNVLSVLSSSYTERQVPLENVQRDPFILPGDATTETFPTNSGQDEAVQLSKKRKERTTAFEQAAERLVLKSVIMSSTPLANLNGKIVRVGDELVSEFDNTTFRVTAITNESVSVVAEDPLLDVSVNVTIPLRRDH
jgi:hypothetical protein